MKCLLQFRLASTREFLFVFLRACAIEEREKGQTGIDMRRKAWWASSGEVYGAIRCRGNTRHYTCISGKMNKRKNLIQKPQGRGRCRGEGIKFCASKNLLHKFFFDFSKKKKTGTGHIDKRDRVKQKNMHYTPKISLTTGIIYKKTKRLGYAEAARWWPPLLPLPLHSTTVTAASLFPFLPPPLSFSFDDFYFSKKKKKLS